MDAEERQCGIGDRIDEIPNETAARRLELVIVATERDDADVRLDACQAGDVIGA